MKAHWPKHKVYHKEQKEGAEDRREGTLLDNDRSIAEKMSRCAEATGDEYCKRFAAAMALSAECELSAAAKAWRKIIKEWPFKPSAYHNLATVLDRAGRVVEAAPMYLEGMKLYKEGTEDWATSAAAAFHVLKHPDCGEAPKPEWWNDEGLKALSTRVAAACAFPGGYEMRAFVLCGDALIDAPWNAGPRKAGEVKEAATWYRHAAMVAYAPAEKQRLEDLAHACDEFADPLLAWGKSLVAKAREAAKVKAKEALMVAEAKANAVAEELLAEEEKEKKQQLDVSGKAGKAKHGKVKKGKSKR